MHGNMGEVSTKSRAGNNHSGISYRIIHILVLFDEQIDIMPIRAYAQFLYNYSILMYNYYYLFTILYHIHSITIVNYIFMCLTKTELKIRVRIYSIQLNCLH